MGFPFSEGLAMAQLLSGSIGVTICAFRSEAGEFLSIVRVEHRIRDAAVQLHL